MSWVVDSRMQIVGRRGQSFETRGQLDEYKCLPCTSRMRDIIQVKILVFETCLVVNGSRRWCQQENHGVVNFFFQRTKVSKNRIDKEYLNRLRVKRVVNWQCIEEKEDFVVIIKRESVWPTDHSRFASLFCRFSLHRFCFSHHLTRWTQHSNNIGHNNKISN